MDIQIVAQFVQRIDNRYDAFADTEHQTKLLNSIPRHTAQWNATVNNSESDNELLILVWLKKYYTNLKLRTSS